MKIDVTPIEIRDYAQSLGWTLVREALRDRLFVLNSPDNDYKQLIFPVEAQNHDFEALAEQAVKRIAEKSTKSIFNIVEEIREVNDDVISLRYYSDARSVNSLSFQEALDAIEATKQMILAAGSTVVNPVLYHKRLSRLEAVELLRKTRFRHTQEGSFILKISCPIMLEAAPETNLFEEDNISKPISRKAFEVINRSAVRLINSIEENSFSELWEEQRDSESPLISYNLCDSLINLFDDERELPFELSFRWSRAYVNKLPTPQLATNIRFPYSFKPRLEEIKNYFRPESRQSTDTFFGTVESLNGNEDQDGVRSGEVQLALIIDGEIVSARAMLNADWYRIAYNAHGQSGSIVKVRGVLMPGRRIRNLDQIEVFELVAK